MKNSVLVTCPDCMKEMQPAGLKAHIKHRSCKGKPDEEVKEDVKAIPKVEC